MVTFWEVSTVYILPEYSSRPTVIWFHQSSHLETIHFYHTLSKWDFFITFNIDNRPCRYWWEWGSRCCSQQCHSSRRLGIWCLFGHKNSIHWYVLAKWQQDWNYTQGKKLQDVNCVVLLWRCSCHFVSHNEVVVTSLRVCYTCFTHTQPSFICEFTLFVLPVMCCITHW